MAEHRPEWPGYSPEEEVGNQWRQILSSQDQPAYVGTIRIGVPSSDYGYENGESSSSSSSSSDGASQGYYDGYPGRGGYDYREAPEGYARPVGYVVGPMGIPGMEGGMRGERGDSDASDMISDAEAWDDDDSGESSMWRSPLSRNRWFRRPWESRIGKGSAEALKKRVEYYKRVALEEERFMQQAVKRVAVAQSRYAVARAMLRLRDVTSDEFENIAWSKRDALMRHHHDRDDSDDSSSSSSASSSSSDSDDDNDDDDDDDDSLFEPRRHHHRHRGFGGPFGILNEKSEHRHKRAGAHARAKHAKRAASDTDLVRVAPKDAALNMAKDTVKSAAEDDAKDNGKDDAKDDAKDAASDVGKDADKDADKDVAKDSAIDSVKVSTEVQATADEVSK